MKIWTSYFYMVRFFRPYIIPLSTAVYDPKWFHEFRGRSRVFLDGNGVINGLRAEKLHPAACDRMCSGRPCEFSPESCLFMKTYREQLFRLDRSALERSFETLGSRIRSALGFGENPEIALLVHEAPDNPCSERAALQEFFGCRELARRDIIGP